MSTNHFRFKQFTIRHERCAMKVGTDGVLLGAWAALPETGRVLDIGTGTGLVALMVSQRAPSVCVTAIDIDADAVSQAKENVLASPFADRVEVLHLSLQDFCASASEPTFFDAILCNPPFFEESLLPPDEARSRARHTTTLPFTELVENAASLLKADGLFSVVLPATAFDAFRLLCFAQGLTLVRRCLVKTTPAKEPKRTLATFVKDSSESRFSMPEETTLVLNHGAQRTAEYAELTRDFYLW